MKKTVGKFTIEGEGDNLSITGPRKYMEEQGDAKIAKITSGNDVVFNMCAGYSPDAETAILVAMQTDYAGWVGMARFCISHGIN